MRADDDLLKGKSLCRIQALRVCPNVLHLCWIKLKMYYVLYPNPSYISCSNILHWYLHCESNLGHRVVRNQPNHTVRSMWEQENTRSTAGLRFTSVFMKTFTYTSPALIFNPQRGHRVHNLNSTIQSLYWSLYCTPVVFVYSLSLSVLDVFTSTG